MINKSNNIRIDGFVKSHQGWQAFQSHKIGKSLLLALYQEERSIPIYPLSAASPLVSFSRTPKPSLSSFIMGLLMTLKIHQVVLSSIVILHLSALNELKYMQLRVASINNYLTFFGFFDNYPVM